MAKVIVERPRRGGGMKFQRSAERTWQRVAADERPRREAIKDRWRQSKVALKSLNENLAPLMRFLRGCVGRPWDEVYSEICERIDRGSAVQLHIWQHVTQVVLTDPRLIRAGAARAFRFGSWGMMYVDPRDGLLRDLVPPVTKRVREARRRRPAADIVQIGVRYYKKIDGLWYEIQLARLPAPGGPAWDAVLRKSTALITRDEAYAAYGGYRYATHKRQLDTRAIRKLLAAINSRRGRD